MRIVVLYFCVLFLVSCDSSSHSAPSEFDSDPYEYQLLGRWTSICYENKFSRLPRWQLSTYEFYKDQYFVINREYSDEACASEISVESVDLNGNSFEHGEWNEYDYLETIINSQGSDVSYYSTVGICPVPGYNNNCDPLSSAFVLAFSVTIQDDILYFSKADLTDEINFDIPYSREAEN